MILDITAGNRHIHGGWMPTITEPEPIIYFDIETRLRIPPDVVCDLRHLPVRGNVAHAIIFDPPTWTFGTSIHDDPTERERHRASFWGNARNLKYLRSLVAGAVFHSHRVLKKQGRLYVKWSDANMPFPRFERYFTSNLTGAFKEVERMERTSRSGRSDRLTRWIIYKKTLG